jgi:CRP/FNR family transcriptional regulator, cyclic AMP receptor protein
MQKPLPTLWPNQTDPHRFLALIAAGRSTSHYPKNTHIFVQGAEADTVIYIQDGQVKVTVTSEHGKEAILAILGPGQFFGEGCLNGQRHRKATTTAMTDCRLTSIEKESMLEALQEQPGFSKFFMDHLLSRNSRIEGDVIDQLFNSSEKRLARLLLLLANYGQEGSPPIAPRYSQPRSACRNDRHHPLACQLLYEQVPQERLD